jgi:hypothetical protein
MLPVIGFKVNTLTINLSVLGITDIQHLDVYIDNLSVPLTNYRKVKVQGIIAPYKLKKS